MKSYLIIEPWVLVVVFIANRVYILLVKTWFKSTYLITGVVNIIKSSKQLRYSVFNFNMIRRNELQVAISNNQNAIEWCWSKKLLSTEDLCPKCSSSMIECLDNEIDGYAWKCSKYILGVRHQVNLSIRNNSIMSGSHLAIKTILQLMYEWSRMTSIYEAAFQLESEDNTAAVWYKRFRDLSACAVRIKLGAPIGGKDDIVEIDECQVIFMRSYKY